MTYFKNITLQDITTYLKDVLMAIRYPNFLDKSLNRVRVDTTGTVSVSGSVTANISLIDSQQGRLIILHQNHSAWATNVRSRF